MLYSRIALQCQQREALRKAPLYVHLLACLSDTRTPYIETPTRRAASRMTAVANTTSIRQRREATVNEHIDAENRHDIEGIIATFHHPRYEVNGEPSEGEEAVRELLQILMQGFPDLNAEIVKLRHLEDGVLVEGLITGTHAGEWVGIAPSGNRINMRVVSIFEFDEDRLMCEKAYMDVATMLAQVGVLPRVG
jgi:steroid delta-isomerase-like uncharacterized protein